MAKVPEPTLPWPVCSLLLFVATSAEEEALEEQAAKLGLDCRKDPALTNHLRERGLREEARTKFDFAVHVGAMLSGAARIHCGRFRDELYGTVPHGNEPIVGGEMEGVGLLAAAVKVDDPAWCVVKGICDFADELRSE